MYRRKGRYFFIVVGPFGVTVWRRGALSMQLYGHFLQVVLGDWWSAT